MKKATESGSMRTVAVLGVFLLIVGATLDLGFARPQVRRIRSLVAQKEKILEEMRRTVSSQRDAAELARCFGGTDLGEVLRAQSEGDVVRYFSEAIDRVRLSRLELSTQRTEEAGTLRTTRYSIHVRGSYGQITAFVHAIESGQRLVRVDAVSIAPPLESGVLEGRIDVTTFVPLVERSSG